MAETAANVGSFNPPTDSSGMGGPGGVASTTGGGGGGGGATSVTVCNPVCFTTSSDGPPGASGK